MILLKKISKILLFFLIIFNVKNSLAATQGRLGKESIGDLNIDLILEDRVFVSNINSTNTISWVGGDDAEITDDLCVYSSSTRYQVTIYDNNITSNKFILKNSLNNTEVPFRVGWNDKAYTNAGYKEVFPGKTLRKQTGASNKDFDCNNSDNARLILFFSKNKLDKAYEGKYEDILTIMIAPE